MLDSMKSDDRLSRRVDALNRRVDEIVAARTGRPRRDSDLTVVLVHAAAAIRRSHDVAAAVKAAKGGDRESPTRAAGDASQAVVSLYLAAAGTRRYCIEHDESGPLGRKALDELVEVARHLRDAVMHWDDKMNRDPETFIVVTDADVLALAPPAPKNPGPSSVVGISWKRLEGNAARLQRWAAFKLDAGNAA